MGILTYKSAKGKMSEALPAAKKRAIMDIVGNTCEMPACKNKAYHVHYIKPVSKGGTTVGSNLIVLCANCYADVRTVPLEKVKEIVKSRSAEKKKAITMILRVRQKGGEEIKGSRSPYGFPSLDLPKFDISSFDDPFYPALQKSKNKSRRKKKDNEWAF